MSILASRRGVMLQCAVVLTALAVMALYPPERGYMLLVPLWGGSVSRQINLIRDADAGLVALGPFPGSIVVIGDRRSLRAALAYTGVIILAAPAVGCLTRRETAGQ